MKAKWLCILLTVAMLASLTTVLTVGVSADAGILQVCTDIVEINGAGHASTGELPADTWFRQTYNGVITDEDGSVSTYRVRGWVNPLDGSEMLAFGYSIGGPIIWNDGFMVDNDGLSNSFPRAERFDVTVALGYLAVGTYEFRMYAKTSSGIHEIENQHFTFEKKAVADMSNVALGKYVYADQSSELGFFSSAMLTDGVVDPFVDASSRLGWVSAVGNPMLQERDQEIYLIIDLEGKFEVGCVNVLPQLFLDGTGLPSSFTILTGMNMDNLTPVAAVRNINETPADSSLDTVTLVFAPVVCKCVALRVDRASWLQESDGSYLSEIGEIEVMGKPAPLSTYTVTFKDGNNVIATVTYTEGAKTVEEPAIPVKEGYVGSWSEYKLQNADIDVRLIWTEVAVTETEPETEPATEPATVPETEPATAPVTEPETEPATTPATEPATEGNTEGGTVGETETQPVNTGKSGCESALTASGIVMLIAVLGVAVIGKKKN